MAIRVLNPSRRWSRLVWPADEVRTDAEKLALSAVDTIPGCEVSLEHGWCDIPFTAWGLECVRTLYELLGEKSPSIAFEKPLCSLATERAALFYPHQYAAIAYVLGHTGSAMIADSMGVGKSREALGIAETYRQQTGRPVLIIGPKFTRAVWQRELLALGCIEQPADLCCLESRDFDSASFQAGHAYYFCHYDVIRAWWPMLHLKVKKLACVIIDEAHWVRNSRTQRAKGTLMVTGLSEHRVLLTGTPVEQRPADLWNLLTLTTGPRTWGGPLKFRQRYCLPGTAPILMADFTERPIKTLTPGDKIVGWERGYSSKRDARTQYRCQPQRRLVEATVAAVLQREAILWEYTLDDGTKFQCTADHQWLTGYSGKHTEYTSPRAGRPGLGGKQGASKAIRILRAPQPKYMNTTQRAADHYRRGYIEGAFRGDGSVVRVTNNYEKYSPFEQIKCRRATAVIKHTVMLAVRDEALIERTATLLHELGFSDFQRSVYRGYYRLSGGPALFTLVDNLRPRAGTRSKAWLAGFLGGIYDAEGSGSVISQYQTANPTTYKLIAHALKTFRFDFRRVARKKGFRMRITRHGFLRFWSIASPVLTRKLRHFLFGKGGKFMLDKHYVVRARRVGKQPVYTLTTTTGNYVAYGLGSRNCGAFHNGHGWEDGEPAHMDELRQRMQPFYLRRTAQEVGINLPEMRRQVEVVELDAEQRPAHDEYLKRFDPEQLVEAILSHSMSDQVLEALTWLRHLTSVGKLQATSEYVENLWEQGERVVVFAWERETVAALQSRLSNAVACHGGLSQEHRDNIVAEFQAGEGPRVLVATLDCLREGVDLWAARIVVFHDLDWTLSRLLQGEARIHRIGQWRACQSIWMVAKGSIDAIVARCLMAKAHAQNQVLGADAGTIAMNALNLEEALGVMSTEDRVAASIERWSAGASR